MASCASCGTTILFGGTKDGQLRFCNATCQVNGAFLSQAAQVPDSEAWGHAKNIHSGVCPKCSGPGPIDIHMSYRVWSLLILTQWQSRTQLSCRSCGVKSQVGNLLLCTFVGWWGFPWGLIMTPVQIVRNIWVMALPPKPTEPSPQLIQASRMQIAASQLHPISNSPA